MYKTLQQALMGWIQKTDDRQKLQHGYVAVIVLLLIAAGLIGLINEALSQQVLALVFIAGGLFLGNLVAWALLQSLVILPLEKRPITRPRSRTTRKR